MQSGRHGGARMSLQAPPGCVIACPLLAHARRGLLTAQRFEMALPPRPHRASRQGPGQVLALPRSKPHEGADKAHLAPVDCLLGTAEPVYLRGYGNNQGGPRGRA
jgi:hypothetical protein